MTEGDVRVFVEELVGASPEAETIIGAWLKDREVYAEKARDAVYDDYRDSYHCPCGGGAGD